MNNRIRASELQFTFTAHFGSTYWIGSQGNKTSRRALTLSSGGEQQDKRVILLQSFYIAPRGENISFRRPDHNRTKRCCQQRVALLRPGTTIEHISRVIGALKSLDLGISYAKVTHVLKLHCQRVPSRTVPRGRLFFQNLHESMRQSC